MRSAACSAAPKTVVVGFIGFLFQSADTARKRRRSSSLLFRQPFVELGLPEDPFAAHFRGRDFAQSAESFKGVLAHAQVFSGFGENPVGVHGSREVADFGGAAPVALDQPADVGRKTPSPLGWQIRRAVARPPQQLRFDAEGMDYRASFFSGGRIRIGFLHAPP